MAEKSVCSIPGCGKSRHSSTMCGMHYMRWKRYGDPLHGKTPHGEPQRYFREVVLSYDGENCLTWPYGRDPGGYAQFNWGGRKRKVHRIVCEEVNGDAPTDTHEAAHECGKGHLGCVSPRHLSWKTRAENEADKKRHGTYALRGKSGSRANRLITSQMGDNRGGG